MTVMRDLNVLESAGLIHLARLEPELEYLFRHSLIQDAAYASLLESDQRWLHHAVGEAIEDLYPDRLDEYAATLARHFERAGDDQHALDYFVRAGDTALACYANQEAASQYQSALALSCSQRQRASLLSGLGEAFYRQGHLDRALGAWREAIDLYLALEDRDSVACLYARSARAAWHHGDTPEGLRLCEEGMEAISGAPESPDVTRLVHETARAYYFNGWPDKAWLLCQQALEMAERLGAIDVLADTLTTQAVLPNQPVEQVLAALHRAVELSEPAGLLQIAHRAHHNLGVRIGNLSTDQVAALYHSMRAVDLAHQRGVASEEMLSLLNAIGTLLGMGRLAEAEAALADIEHLVDAMPDPEALQPDLDGVRAGVMWLRGERAESLRLVRAALAQARQRGNLQMVFNHATDLAWSLLELDRLGETVDWSEVHVVLDEASALGDLGLGGKVWPRCLLSMVWARQRELSAARRHLAEAREVAAVDPSAWNEEFFHMSEAELATAEGRWHEALAAAEAVAGFHAEWGRRWAWANALSTWAQIHIRRGDPGDLERAQALLSTARDAFREIGSVQWAAEIDVSLQALRTEAFARALVSDKFAEELAAAGRIQEGFLPEAAQVPGWQIAVALEPARETSGDFYDFIPLPDGCLGIVVADVADKGAGAALYMTLSRTLLRTYAIVHASQPEKAVSAVNERILAETHTDMFVTLFYGVLDPKDGTLTYCNAGHNPPYWLNARMPGEIRTLIRTGLPLGIVEDMAWQARQVRLETGDSLVLYTDGITDAQNPEGLIFGSQRLLKVLRDKVGSTAKGIQEALLSEIHCFVAQAPPSDDITVMVLVRGDG
jgi:serine phosphatase RsbU (regulator of sigma subunit)/tetratricopeptide (TPR) repeat protein